MFSRHHGSAHNVSLSSTNPTFDPAEHLHATACDEALPSSSFVAFPTPASVTTNRLVGSVTVRLVPVESSPFPADTGLRRTTVAK
jgi:hypothetical protein